MPGRGNKTLGNITNKRAEPRPGPERAQPSKRSSQKTNQPGVAVMQKCSSDCHGPFALLALEMDDFRHREGIEIPASTERERAGPERPVGRTFQPASAMKRNGSTQGSKH